MVPDKTDAISQIKAYLTGKLSAAEVSDWALRAFVRAKDKEPWDPKVKDAVCALLWLDDGPDTQWAPTPEELKSHIARLSRPAVGQDKDGLPPCTSAGSINHRRRFLFRARAAAAVMRALGFLSFLLALIAIAIRGVPPWLRHALWLVLGTSFVVLLAGFLVDYALSRSDTRRHLDHGGPC